MRRDIDKPERKIKVWKTVLIVLIVILILLILAFIAVRVVFHHYYGKLNYDDGNMKMVTTETVPDEDINPDATDSDAEQIADVEEQIRRNMEDKSTPLMFSEDVYNILLIGQDSRDKNTLGRSDSMIIVSINRRAEEIIMTSIMRDSYVYIPDCGYSRINAAYAYGGPDLLIDTIESNFKIQIDSYVAVNFYSFIDVVDAVGGVEITVRDEEVKYLNNGVVEMNRLEGVPENTDKLEQGGTYILNGKQALGYARIRYVGNADYERTERQRRVLSQVFENMKDCSLSELNDILNTILPEVTTDIEEGEMFSLLLDTTAKYKDYDLKQYRVPYDGTIQDLTINGAMVLGIDLPQNIANMRRNIYGE